MLADTDNNVLSGNLRLAYLNIEEQLGEHKASAALGGELAIKSQFHQVLTVGTTFYITQELFNDQLGDFFSSKLEDYSILGEAYLQLDIAGTQIKAGRFEFNSPHLDTDDIRMIPNTFSGVVMSYAGFKDSQWYLAHITQWAGVDAPMPEQFTDINSQQGITLFGGVYQGNENLNLQSWYYHGEGLADLLYLEASYQIAEFTLSSQYGYQRYETEEIHPADSSLFGIMASYQWRNLALNLAYNTTLGTVINGFGGGPYFTSAADHTIEGIADQRATAFGFEYMGFDSVTLSVLAVDFFQGANETDYSLCWQLTDGISVEFVYHDMHQDGKMMLALLNAAF